MPLARLVEEDNEVLRHTARTLRHRNVSTR